MGEGDCWGGPIGEGVWGGGIGEDWGEGLVIPPRSTSSFYFADLKNNQPNIIVQRDYFAAVLQYGLCAMHNHWVGCRFSYLVNCNSE